MSGGQRQFCVVFDQSEGLALVVQMDAAPGQILHVILDDDRPIAHRDIVKCGEGVSYQESSLYQPLPAWITLRQSPSYQVNFLTANDP